MSDIRAAAAKAAEVSEELRRRADDLDETVLRLAAVRQASERADGETIRAWIVDRVTEIIDNKHEPYELVTAAAEYATRGIPVAERETAIKPVGEAVRDWLREFLRREIDGGDDDTRFLLGILQALLDLNDAEQVRLLGEHYLPEPDYWPQITDEDRFLAANPHIEPDDPSHPRHW